VESTTDILEKALTKQVNSAASALAGGNRKPKIKKGAIKKAYAEAWIDTVLLFAGETFNALDIKEKSLKRLNNLKDFTDEEMKLWTERVQEHLDEHGGKRITLIDGTTQDWVDRNVGNLLEAAARDGQGVAEAARNLRKEWGEIARFRAERIARTEIVAASNFGTMEGATATGLKMRKKWLHTPDERTRDEHRTEGGEDWIGLEKLFTLSDGSKLSQPGDFTNGAAADQIINCRCTILLEVV